MLWRVPLGYKPPCKPKGTFIEIRDALDCVALGVVKEGVQGRSWHCLGRWTARQDVLKSLWGCVQKKGRKNALAPSEWKVGSTEELAGAHKGVG